jgi:hypothetical protein
LDAAKSLVLWLNSTLGICLTMGSRAETEGAWVKFKKPTLHALPVLDVRRLTAEQLRMAGTFDDLAKKPLEPLPRLREDRTRQAVDEALCRVLGLPDLGELRQQLASEPILALKPLAQRLLEDAEPAPPGELPPAEAVARSSRKTRMFDARAVQTEIAEVAAASEFRLTPPKEALAKAPSRKSSLSRRRRRRAS